MEKDQTLTAGMLTQMLQTKGVPEPQVDEYLVAILNHVRTLNSAVDMGAFYALYQTAVRGHGKEFGQSTGKVSLGRTATDEHSSYGGEEYSRVVTAGPFLHFLREEIKMPDVYLLETAYVSNFPRTGSGGDYSLHPEHYFVQYYESFYVAPGEFDSLLRFCVLARNFSLRETIFGHADNYRNIIETGIRYLGKERGQGALGNKEAGFVLFDRLRLPYPPGIVLSEDLVKKLLQSPHEDQLRLTTYILESLARTGICLSGASFAVRSNPRHSMPGVFATQFVSSQAGSRRMGFGRGENQDSTVTISPVDLLRAIKAVKDSWDSVAAGEYRKRAGFPEAYDMPIIIQKWESPVSDQDEYAYDQAVMRSIQKGKVIAGPLYASGAFSTRDPNSNEKVLWGRYNVNANGDSLMTRGEPGRDVNELAKVTPVIYRQLLEAQTKLEAAAGPQEVEFVVSGDRLYFLQTRSLNFAPTAEICYLRELLSAGKITEALAIRSLEAVQQRLNHRKIYRLKKDSNLKPLATAQAATAGAFQGCLAFNEDQAHNLFRVGKPVVFVISDATSRRKLLPLLFAHPASALITSSGNGSSHEAVLTRLSGIPALICLGSTFGEQEIVIGLGTAAPGRCLRAGDQVVIDGNKGVLYAASLENVLEEDGVVSDASYGIDIPVMRKAFLASYLNAAGRIRSEFTVQYIEELNQAAVEKFQRLEASGNKKAAFVANLEKHFLHDLLALRQQAE